MTDDLDAILNQVGSRLRTHRHRAAVTLASLSKVTGISVSTLSRLESGARRATLDLLLPLADFYGVSLSELVGEQGSEDPRVTPQPIVQQDDTIAVPLMRRPGHVRAFKQTLPAGPVRNEPDLQSGDGYHWIFVLRGQLRLILGGHDMILEKGEVAEFDTQQPHWFGKTDPTPVEYLVLLEPRGERCHIWRS